MLRPEHGAPPPTALDPRVMRNAVAEDPAREVGGVVPTYEVRGVWVSGRRGRSAPDADRIPVAHRRSGLRLRRLLIWRLIRNDVAVIGRAHVCNPVTTAHPVRRLLPQKNYHTQTTTYTQHL